MMQEDDGASPNGSACAGQGARRNQWRCPLCDHTLSYAPRDRETAELAANSHMSRRHPETKTIVLLPAVDGPEPHPPGGRPKEVAKGTGITPER
jgi:hypothetical protein